jgi:hypothetical protein
LARRVRAFFISEVRMRLLLALLFVLPAVLLAPSESLAGSITATITEPPATYTDGTQFARPVTYILWGGPEGQTPRELARSVELIVRASSLAPGRYCAQVFAVDMTPTRSVYSDGFPATPWCGTVPDVTVPPPPDPVAKKPNPVRAVTFETAAE